MGRMVQIDDFIKELQETRRKFGNTCVYIRDVSWGAVALNREKEDEEAEKQRTIDAMWPCPCGRKHKASVNKCRSCGYVRC